MSKFIDMRGTCSEGSDRQRVVNRLFKSGQPFSVYAYSVTDRSRYEYGNPHHVGWRKDAQRPKAKPHAQARIRVRVIPKREVLEYNKWPTVKIGKRYHLVNHELRYLTPGLFSANTLYRSRKLFGQDNNYRDLLRTNYIREFGQ